MRMLYMARGRSVINAPTDQRCGGAPNGYPKLRIGLRTDTSGNLYVALILKGTIAVLTPAGKLKREIALKAKEPTNLAFGGIDGKTVFVTQRQGGFVESFRADHPGREFCFTTCAGAKDTR